MRRIANIGFPAGRNKRELTDKTHITIDGLEAETEYIFQVEAVDKGEKLSSLLPQSSRVRMVLPSSAKLQSKDGGRRRSGWM